MSASLLRRHWCALLLLALCMPAWAEITTARQFPPDTKRGVLDMSAYPNVKLDGKLRYFSPAIRIFNNENLIVLASTLDADNIKVNYTENPYGDIDRVWILTTEEIGVTLPKPQVWAPIPFKNPEIK